MSVSIEEVRRIAALSHLEFDEAELQTYAGHLNEILDYINKLNELDTSQVEITYHPVVLPERLREDEVRDGLPVDRVFENAPQKTWQYFVVPKVVG